MQAILGKMTHLAKYYNQANGFVNIYTLLICTTWQTEHFEEYSSNLKHAKDVENMPVR